MKSHRLLKKVVLLWTLAAMSASLLPGTLAKYTATGKGSAGARIAGFDPEWRLYYDWEHPDNAPNFVTAGGGYVMHPGSWYVPVGGGTQYFDFVQLFYFRNKGEVVTNFQYRLMSYTDKEPSAAAHGNYSVGEYVHNTRTRLDPATNFGAYVGAEGTWVPARMQMDIPVMPGVDLGINPASPPAALSHLFIAGLASSPIRPAGSFNGSTDGKTNVTDISQSDPIRFGVGTNSISDMKDKWWRSYRANIDLVASQVD